MLLDVTKELFDLHGKPILSDNKEPLTVRAVIEFACVTRVQNESLDASEQLDRFILASKAVHNDELTLKSEQIIKLKKWIAARFTPVVTGQLCLMLEGQTIEDMEEGD